MEAKGLRFKPDVYLTDGWGCPDRVPVIGIPFYLADPRLRRLEEEQTGEIEDERTIMMLLRHEAGHAVNYAYRLWRAAELGRDLRPVHQALPGRLPPRPDQPRIRPPHRRLPLRPDLRPEAPGRGLRRDLRGLADARAPTGARRYRNWPVIRKLLYVDRLMKEIRGPAPAPAAAAGAVRPVDSMNLPARRALRQEGRALPPGRPGLRRRQAPRGLPAVARPGPAAGRRPVPRATTTRFVERVVAGPC